MCVCISLSFSLPLFLPASLPSCLPSSLPLPLPPESWFHPDLAMCGFNIGKEKAVISRTLEIQVKSVGVILQPHPRTLSRTHIAPEGRFPGGGTPALTHSPARTLVYKLTHFFILKHLPPSRE